MGKHAHSRGKRTQNVWGTGPKVIAENGWCILFFFSGNIFFQPRKWWSNTITAVDKYIKLLNAKLCGTLTSFLQEDQLMHTKSWFFSQVSCFQVYLPQQPWTLSRQIADQIIQTVNEEVYINQQKKCRWSCKVIINIHILTNQVSFF